MSYGALEHRPAKKESGEQAAHQKPRGIGGRQVRPKPSRRDKQLQAEESSGRPRDYTEASLAYQALLQLLREDYISSRVPPSFQPPLAELAAAMGGKAAASSAPKGIAPRYSDNPVRDFDNALQRWEPVLAYFQDATVRATVAVAADAVRTRLASKTPLERARSRVDAATELPSGKVVAPVDDTMSAEEVIESIETLRAELPDLRSTALAVRSVILVTRTDVEINAMSSMNSKFKLENLANKNDEDSLAEKATHTATRGKYEQVNGLSKAYGFAERALSYYKRFDSAYNAIAQLKNQGTIENLQSAATLARDCTSLFQMALQDSLRATALVLNHFELPGASAISAALAAGKSMEVLQTQVRVLSAVAGTFAAIGSLASDDSAEQKAYASIKGGIGIGAYEGGTFKGTGTVTQPGEGAWAEWNYYSEFDVGGKYQTLVTLSPSAYSAKTDINGTMFATKATAISAERCEKTFGRFEPL